MDKLQAYCMRICEQIHSQLCASLSRIENGQNARGRSELDSLFECGPAIVNLLHRQARIISQKPDDRVLMQRRLNDLISLAKEKFYAYPFKDVPECWRRLFTDASILQACSAVVPTRSIVTDESDGFGIAESTQDATLDFVVKTLDMAVIMAGAPGVERIVWIEKIMDLLEPLCKQSFAAKEVRQEKRRKLHIDREDTKFPISTMPVPPVTFPVERAVSLSFSAFENYMATPNDPSTGPRPMIIENVMEHWPARNEHPWDRPSYLLSKTLNGRRLVPVEVGRSYVDDGWGQKLISFKEFMNDYLLRSPSVVSESKGILSSSEEPLGFEADGKILAPASKTGYLAQHDLFTQIQSLRADISIPDYCYTSPSRPHPSSPLASKHANVPELQEPLLNAWLGPAGTISPMHVDPYHNILAQVVGKKYVRLYAPAESTKLYPRGVESGGVDMCNTSTLDIGVLEGWDGSKEDQDEALRAYPLYRNAVFVDVILQDGQCLYIPLGWWHYVRSLSVSFSVSFWWN